VDDFIAIAERAKLRIAHVLETHVHADFVSGARELKRRLGDSVTIHCSGMGGPEWTPPYADRVARGGDAFHMGSLRIVAMHTPGHTPEHVTWALYDETRSADVPWLLFTGDFVFVGSIGRPDLLGEEARRRLAHQLYESVFGRLPSIPDFTEIFPGHGAGSLCGKALGSRGSSTLGFERQFNASLKPLEESEWTAAIMADMPVAPPYFLQMKKVNAAGPALLEDAALGRRAIAPMELAEMSANGTIVLDARPKESFAAGHVAGSINIPLHDTLPTWAGWVLPYDKPIALVLENDDDLAPTVTHLTRIGLDRIEGHLKGGIGAWETGGFELARLETASVHELAARLNDGAARPNVLDVRSEGEWKSGHIAGAINIHAGLLEDRVDEVPDDRPLAVICGSGYRSSIACSLLMRAGRRRLTNVLGGMTAWRAAGLPVV
jgi:hydroxyacylglutathione hydrolase